MTTMNQKEYLKKYLSRKKEGKKKKRKKQPIIGEGVKIIDDDIDISKLTSLQEAADLLNTNEDAPQVVGVIDERPMHLRIDDYRKSDLWKPLGTAEQSEPNEKGDLSPSSCIKLMLYNESSSPPRRRKKDASPESIISRRTSDHSPRRRRNERSPSRITISEFGGSPQRRNDDDHSPPRRIKREYDNSPPRKTRHNSDHSPPRRNNDSSPPRKNKKSRWGDESPPRRSVDPQPSTSKTEEPQKRKLLPGNKKGKYLIPAKRQKTLDGKAAGLQSAKELVKENEAFRQREDELFKKMSTDVSGANAAPVLRDRKTGKIRDLQKEAEERKEKEKKEDENKEKYSRWGKGLKQVERYEDKLVQDLHEMNKPLARYADDEDLERYLKEQEREGDPMLDYIRKKKKKVVIESGVPFKPQYEGEFMPNRFGIVPGYRWDGVDRSNEYEKKWFQVQNEKRAQQEEIYKWSTEDM